MLHISGVFMGCFPCDTRLEAFPPYLGRVSFWRGFFSIVPKVLKMPTNDRAAVQRAARASMKLVKVVAWSLLVVPAVGAEASEKQRQESGGSWPPTTYQPGRDVRGRPVAPADLPRPDLPAPDRLRLEIPVAPPGGPERLDLEVELPRAAGSAAVADPDERGPWDAPRPRGGP